MKRYIPAMGIILLAISLSMMLAIICEYFDVYIPGIALLIPVERRPSPSPIAPTAHLSPIIREKVIVIDRTHTPSASWDSLCRSAPDLLPRGHHLIRVLPLNTGDPPWKEDEYAY